MPSRIVFPLILSVVLFVTLSGALFFHLTHPGGEEVQAYQALIAKARIAGTKQQSNPYTAQQVREGVRKDFSFDGGVIPLQGRLYADTSVLVFDRGDAGSEAVEYMTGVTGFIQEEVRDATQVIRTITASNAEYHYKTEQLFAIGVTMERYQVSGTEITEELACGQRLMTGNAEEFACSLGEGRAIRLCKGVRLVFQEGGELQCACGEIDCVQKNGTVTGDPVVYTEKIETTKHLTGDALVIRSPRMTFTYAEGKGAVLDTIVAEEAVSVTYGTTFQVDADEGSYCRKEQDGDVVVLKASGEEGQCYVTDQDGGRIDGTEIRLWPLFHCLECDDPVGHLKSPTDVDFTARHLFWNGNFHTLILKDEVVVQQEGFGEIQTNDELILVRDTLPGKGGITKMLANGYTVLTHRPDEEAFEHTLICDGTIVIDHEKGTALLESRDNPAGEQVTYRDRMGKVYADRGEIAYTLTEGRFIPSQIHLMGNVRLMNHVPGTAHTTDGVLQYVVADDMVYHPKTREMLLTSYEENRVLLYDKGNHLEVSAPALILSRDHLTKRETLEGKGDVRFRFIEHELEQLRKSFLFVKEETS